MSKRTGLGLVAAVTAMALLAAGFALARPGAAVGPLPLEPGDIVVANGGDVARVPAGGGAAEVLVDDPTFSWIEDVAIDGAGNLILADLGNNTIFRVLCETGTVETVATLTDPNADDVHDVVVDANGDYIVLVHYDTSLFRVTPGGSVSLITTITGASETEGLDIDGSGNFIVADEFPSSNPPPGLLYRISPDGSSIEVLGDDSATSDGPEAVIVDINGDFIVVDETGEDLYRVSPDGFTITLIYDGAIFGSDGPQGVALAPDNDFLVSDDSGNQIVKVARDGSSATVLSSGAPLSGARDLAVYSQCAALVTPTPTPTPTPTATPTATATPTPTPTPTSTPSGAAPVTELPATGAPPSGGTGAAIGWLVVLAAVGALGIAGGAAFGLARRRRG